MPKIIVKDHKYYFKIRGLGGPKGDKGDTGPAGPQGPQGPYVNVVAGTTTTLPAGSSAQVTVNNTGNTSVLNFGVPQGAKGDKGDAGTPGAQGPRGFAATVNVGETTTGAPGTNASVINAGNENDAVLKFTIPKGEKGETGETGPQGPTGGVKSTVVAELPETGESDKYYLVYRDSEGGTITTTDGYAQIENGENAGDLTASQLLGNAEQTTYSGKNLLNIDFTSTTTMGITITNNGDGTITVSGTTTGAAGVNLSPSATNQDNPLTLAPNTAYTQRIEILSGTSNFSVVPAFKDSGGTVHYNFFSNNQTATTTDTMACTYYNIYWGTAGRVINATFRVWLEKGSDLTSPFEPYVGGIPAPNPSYPQPISTVTGAQNIKVVGKNLLPTIVGSATRSGVTISADNGTVTATGSATADMTFTLTGNGIKYDRQYFQAIPATSDNSVLLDAGTYYFSGNRQSNNVSLIMRLVEDGAPLGSGTAVTANSTFTIATQKRFCIAVYVDNGKTPTLSLSNLQLELGNSASSFEPYTAQDYTISLGSIELAKIGTYQDRIYKNDGKWYIEKQVGKVVFDGTEDGWLAEGGGAPYRIPMPDFFRPSPSSILAICDHFEPVPYNTNWNNYTSLITTNATGSATAFKFRYTAITSLADWKTWLSTHNTTVYYALATPTTTEITDETLRAQLNFLASLYKGENNISLVGTGAQGEFTGNYVVYDKYNRHKVYIWSSDDNTWQIIVQ